MSEKRWRDCADPEAMLAYLDGKTSARKLRLIGCAACRYVWEYLSDIRSRTAVEIAEKVADGLETLEELDAAYKQAIEAMSENQIRGSEIGAAFASVHQICYPDTSALPQSAQRCLGCVAGVGVFIAGREVDSGKMAHAPNWEMLVKKREEGRMARIIREIVGNPFKPVEFLQAWRSEGTINLASAMYSGRAFARMAELGNALEASGCRNKAILEHCEETRPHYRGCWVIDGLLGMN